MKRNYTSKAGAAVLAGLLTMTLMGCGGTASVEESAANRTQSTEVQIQEVEGQAASADAANEGEAENGTYTERDLEQTADTSEATSITVQSGQDVSITEAGVYVLSGAATDATVSVNVDSTEKVQLVLDGLSIQNEDAPAINVLSADKVFVTTAQGSQNTLSVSGSITSNDETNVDAVIFSKDDLVLNGLGTLEISSADNGVSGKDDVKVTGGSYVITASSCGIEANDGIYVGGGSLSIEAQEGMEATVVQIDDGTVGISASDDGINATTKNDDGTTPCIDILGGEVTVTMAEGDTDALDSNGTLYISGGTVSITAQSAFDFDVAGELRGGTVYVNGEQVTSIESSMMGGGMGGAGMGNMRGGRV